VASVGEPYRSDLAQGLQAHVATLLGPLLGAARCCSEPMRRMMAARSGKMPTTSVCRRISLCKRSSKGWYSRSGARAPSRKCGKATRSQRACSRCQAALRQLPSQRVNHSLELSLHLGGVRLVDDGAHQGCHSRAACDLATLASRSRKLVGATGAAGWTLATSPRSPRRAPGGHRRSRVPPR
jgi:hypothetical protein